MATHSLQSDATLAEMAVKIAQAVPVKCILCVTETGDLARIVERSSDHGRIVAASTNADSLAALTTAGLETIHLPVLAADRYRQIRHVLSVALQTGKVSPGDLIVCAMGAAVYPQEGAFLLVTEVEPAAERLPLTELVRLTDSIQPQVLEAALVVASKIGRVVSRGGARAGAIFVLGDSVNVLNGSHQIVPNPFHGHDADLRMLTNPHIHDSLVELAKLDGAFVVRGDGFIQSAAVFLAASEADISIPGGLGTRHVTAASVTARTTATAVVVSATDGNVRVFSGGQLVLLLDPEVPYGPVALE